MLSVVFLPSAEADELSNASLPLLLEDGSRLDWPDGKYEPRVGLTLDKANVTHSITGAPSLESAVAKGRAKWASELLCPKTLLSRTVLSTETEQTVGLKQSELDGAAWIVPGLLATQDFELRAEELGPFWKGATLLVPCGWWLARGTKRRIKTLAQSLLSFRLDELLENGQMHVLSLRGDGEPRFEACIAGDIWREIESDRTLQVAALIGACAKFPKVFSREKQEDSAIEREIRNRLEEAEVPVWDEPDYDAALAATAIERFYPTRASEDLEN